MNRKEVSAILLRPSLFEDKTMNGDPQLLLDLVKMPMPFGKYKGTLLCNLPVAYLEWFQRKGFPAGKLGNLLQTLYEIRLNGLEYLLDPLKKQYK